MSNFQIQGKLHRKFDTEHKSQTFSVREFVVEVPDGNYPQFVKFQLSQDRCDLLDKFNEGDTLTVHFNLRGREWEGKYFTTLNAWRLVKPTGAQMSAPPAENGQKAAENGQETPEMIPAALGEGGEAILIPADDLPF